MVFNRAVNNIYDVRIPDLLKFVYFYFNNFDSKFSFMNSIISSDSKVNVMVVIFVIATLFKQLVFKLILKLLFSLNIWYFKRTG